MKVVFIFITIFVVCFWTKESNGATIKDISKGVNLSLENEVENEAGETSFFYRQKRNTKKKICGVFCKRNRLGSFIYPSCGDKRISKRFRGQCITCRIRLNCSLSIHRFFVRPPSTELSVAS